MYAYGNACVFVREYENVFREIRMQTILQFASSVHMLQRCLAWWYAYFQTQAAEYYEHKIDSNICVPPAVTYVSLLL